MSSESGAFGEAFERVRTGGGREVCLVSGEAGAGKSTLVAAVAHLAFDAGACLLYGHRGEDLAAPYQHFTQSLDLDGTVVVITTELRPQLSAAARIAISPSRGRFDPHRPAMSDRPLRSEAHRPGSRREPGRPGPPRTKRIFAARR